MSWIHRRGITDFEQMTDLALGFRAMLLEEADCASPPAIGRALDADGTEKWLFQVDPHNVVETVIIPDEGRRTLCLSSQAGCVLNCAFCATGAQGFSRNLTSAEIVGQLWRVWHDPDGSQPKRPIHNVVFMGMGEPLANYRALSPVLRLLLDGLAYGFSKWRVTVSTAGLVPLIDRLAAEHDVALAVSLHAADDTLRDRLVPINRAHPLAELLAACHRYVSRHPGREILIEYVMLDGVNDQLADAHALARLLRAIPAKVNLIPFNPFPEAAFTSSPESRILAFQKVLIDRGLRTHIRKPRGQSIQAACGQLAGSIANRLTDRSRFASPRARA
ncbi:radical SAM enzyme, Cfr family [mine drainage metagenome]|uniref:Radical SAM enzyme, Cfr family n=1 Tax=mine drainage metagenome TaxID=410659 RepID=T0ZW74_9ZZZZ